MSFKRFDIKSRVYIERRSQIINEDASAKNSMMSKLIEREGEPI
jgi:hypothetical protein